LSKFTQAAVVVGCFFVGLLCMVAERAVWQSTKDVQVPQLTIRERLALRTDSADSSEAREALLKKKSAIEKAQRTIKNRRRAAVALFAVGLLGCAPLVVLAARDAIRLLIHSFRHTVSHIQSVLEKRGDVEKGALTMNRKQKIILWIGIVIIVLMCLFPPWVRVFEIKGSRLVSSPFYEFPRGPDGNWWRYKHFLLSPPTPICPIYEIDHSNLWKDFPFDYTWGQAERFDEQFAEQRFGIDYVRVDLQRLGIQCVIVALIAAGLLCTFTTKEKYKHKEQKSGD